MSSLIPVEVVFALPEKQRIVKLDVPVGILKKVFSSVIMHALYFFLCVSYCLI